MIHLLLMLGLGLAPPPRQTIILPVRRAAPVRSKAAPDFDPMTPNTARLFAMHGFVGPVSANQRLSLMLRNGRVLQVDIRYVMSRGLSGQLIQGRAVVVNGYFDRLGVFHAANIENTEALPSSWPLDGPLNDPHSRTKADIKP